MLVYGDTQEEVATADYAREVGRDIESLRDHSFGLARHQATVAAFIKLAALTQGVADRECERHGHDELSARQDQLLEVLRSLAADIDQSWRSGFKHQPCPERTAQAIEVLQLPPEITLKHCEGYAYYGVYPEAYLAAARGLPGNCVVIGLRSIGTGLAALVAAACGATNLFTLRPSGDPFRRSVKVGPRLEQAVRAADTHPFVIVDEGPGLSGSSFGGVADWLESLGVARSRIIFMPSHPGDLGPEAAPEHRARWAGADRRIVTFEELFTSPGAHLPLHSWFADITGGLVEPWTDLSAGAWANDRPRLPTSPSREARKFLIHGSRGKFLVKFVGLDAAADAKFARARALHRAGFCPEPLALRYGFMLERYVDGAPARQVPTALLCDYLAFRDAHFPAAHGGASLAELLRMAEHNIGKAVPEIDFGLAARWSEARLQALQEAVRPVHVDGRLHAWEWLQSGSDILKTDAVDHSASHDLVGCQDILWDVAGAAIELGVTGEAQADLAAAFADSPARRDLLQLMTLCYLGFQLGWWTFAATAEGWKRREWYRDKVESTLRACA